MTGAFYGYYTVEGFFTNQNVKTMTREEILQDILLLDVKNLLIEAGTGVGKTRLAIEKVKQCFPKGRILVVVPRIVLIETWKDEFKAWGCAKLLPQVEFVTYVSYPKKKGEYYDIQIFDEAHHLSERCRAAVPSVSSNMTILLTATVGYKMKQELQRLFKGLYTYRVTLQEAITNEILAEPRIILIPLKLNSMRADCIYEVNPKAEKQYTADYNQWLKHKWTFLRSKSKDGVKVKCSEAQYYSEISGLINWYKDRFEKTTDPRLRAIRKNTWLHECSKRLVWLSDRKSSYVLTILKQLSNYRTLTFCNSIQQTELLGKYCINSKNKKATEYLDLFNSSKIKHITACGMLNEGANLTKCQFGIFANLNASEIISIQRVGRILRHKKPFIIIPYFKDTREEEILNKMLEQYDKSLIETQLDYRNITL